MSGSVDVSVIDMNRLMEQNLQLKMQNYDSKEREKNLAKERDSLKEQVNMLESELETARDEVVLTRLEADDAARALELSDATANKRQDEIEANRMSYEKEIAVLKVEIKKIHRQLNDSKNEYDISTKLKADLNDQTNDVSKLRKSLELKNSDFEKQKQDFTILRKSLEQTIEEHVSQIKSLENLLVDERVRQKTDEKKNLQMIKELRKQLGSESARSHELESRVTDLDEKLKQCQISVKKQNIQCSPQKNINQILPPPSVTNNSSISTISLGNKNDIQYLIFKHQEEIKLLRLTLSQLGSLLDNVISFVEPKITNDQSLDILVHPIAQIKQIRDVMVGRLSIHDISHLLPSTPIKS